MLKTKKLIAPEGLEPYETLVPGDTPVGSIVAVKHLPEGNYTLGQVVSISPQKNIFTVRDDDEFLYRFRWNDGWLFSANEIRYTMRLLAANETIIVAVKRWFLSDIDWTIEPPDVVDAVYKAYLRVKV